MIYIGTDEGIYRWFQGANWAIFHGLQDRSVIGLASPGPGVLVAIDRAGAVLETTDNGLSWRAVPMPQGAGRPSAVAIGGEPPAVMVTAKPLGVFSRPLGAPVPKAPPAPRHGEGWRPRVYNTGLDLAQRATALLAPGRPREAPTPEAVRLAGWVPLGSPPAPRSAVAPEARAVAAAPGAWYAAVGGAGLWKTADGGRTWSQCHGLPAEVYAVRAVPGRDAHVWAATEDGCWFSADAGATWEDRSGGLENDRHARALDVKPGAPDTLLAGCAPRAGAAAAGPGGAVPRQGLNFALFESTNGGKTWTQVKKNFPDRLEYDTIADIRYDPADPDCVLVALGSGELWNTANGGFYWGPLARQIRAARCLCATA